MQKLKKIVKDFFLATITFVIFLCSPFIVFTFNITHFSYILVAGFSISFLLICFYFLLTMRFVSNFATFKSSFKNSCLLGIVSFFVITALVLLWEAFTHNTSHIDFIKTLGFQRSYLEDFCLVVTIVLLAPLCEELTFRLLIYTFLKRGFTRFLSSKSASIIAIGISSLAFALSHGAPEQSSQLFAIFIIGICLALTYEYSKSLIAPILAHSLNNSLALYGSLEGANIALTSQNLYYLLVLLPLVSIIIGTLLQKISTYKFVRA